MSEEPEPPSGEEPGDPPEAPPGPGSSGSLPDAPGGSEPAAGGNAVGAEVVPLRPHRFYVDQVLSLGNGHGAALSGDGTVSLFDIGSGRPRAARRLFRRVEEAWLWTNRSGNVVVAHGFDSSHGDTMTIVWDLRTDVSRPLEPLREDERSSDEVDVSPDGERVAYLTEGEPDRLVIQPVAGGRARAVPMAEGGARLIGFDPDGRVIAVLIGRSVELRDARTGQLAGEPLFPGEVDDAVFRPTGGAIAVRASDVVRVVDTRSRAVLGEARHDGFTPDAVSFSADGARLIVCDREGNMRIHASADLAQVRSAALGARCGGDLWFDTRPDPPVVYAYRRRRTGEGEPTETPEVIQIGRAADGERVFVREDSGGVAVWDPATDRARPVARQGRGEQSVWSFTRSGSSFTLAGREWSQQFGDAPAPAPPAPGPDEPVFPSLPAEEGTGSVDAVVESDDGRRRVVAREQWEDNRFRHYLLVAGGAEPIELTPPRGTLAHECIDQESGAYSCAANGVFSPDGETVALGGDESTWLFGADGRVRGRVHPGSVTFAPDGSALVVLQENGTVTLHDTASARTRGTVLTPSEAVRSAELTFAGPSLLAIRARTLVILDVATGERRHRITLPTRAVGAATIVDDGAVARVRLVDGFVYHRLDDGSLVRRVEVDAVRGVTADQSRVALCIGGQLHARPMSSEDPGRPLGHCPAVEVELDDRFVWWHEGTTGTVVRVADGQRLTVRVLQLRRPVRIAYTAEGHVQADTHALGELLFRAPGPLLDAPLSRLEASRMSPTLVADFLAGRPLGPVPR